MQPHFKHPIYIWQQPDWPQFRWDSTVLLEPLSRGSMLYGKLQGQMALAGFAEQDHTQLEALTSELVASSQIEGVTLNPASVRSSIARRLGLEYDGLLCEDHYVEGLTQVMADAVTNCRQPLTADRIFNTYSGGTDIHVTPKGGLQAMWNPSNKVATRLNYTVGTQYPPLSSLQNYGQFTDSLIYTTSNPSLRPGVNHEVVLSSTFLNSLTLEGRYTHNANSIFRYYEPKEGVVPSRANTYFTENSPVNGTYNIWSVNLTYTKQFGKRWMASATGKIVGNRASYGSFSNSKVLPEYSWFILYQIPERSWQFYLSGSMQSYSMITPQIKQWSLDDGMAVSVSKTMLQNRLQIVGMWYIPVHFSDGRWHGGLTSESYVTSYWANNQFRKNNLCQLSIVYMFNKGNNVRKYNRSSESIQL